MALGVAMFLATTLTGCEYKVRQVSVVCQPPGEAMPPITWYFTSKVDNSELPRIPPAIQVVLGYRGPNPRTAPPVTIYLFRPDGSVLRVFSSSTATMPPKSDYVYHVDTGGYFRGLMPRTPGAGQDLSFVVEVDGAYYGGELSHLGCDQFLDHHLVVAKATKLPDLGKRHPLNMASSEWLQITDLPPAVLRKQGDETATYAFFSGPIPLTDTGNDPPVPDGVTKQLASVGATVDSAAFPLTYTPPAAEKAAPAAKANGG